MWISEITEQVFNRHDEIRSTLRPTELPAIITDECLAEFRIVPVAVTVPTFDAATHKAVQVDPVKVNGVWTQQWQIIALTVEEITAIQMQKATQIKESVTRMAEQRLNDFAATRSYSNVDSLEKYKNLTDAEIATLPDAAANIVRRYRIECRYLVLETAHTWATLELIMAEVLNGARPMPSSYTDIEPDLPVLVWPV